MSRFPDPHVELAELQAFLAESESKQEDGGIAALRAEAERLVARLRNPVRVAIAGLPEAGKSTLAEFLASQSLNAPEGALLPPVMFMYAAKPATIAGWWDGRQISHPGISLDAALSPPPDFIEVRLPNAVLKDVSFLDLPGLEGAQERRDQVTWVARRADIILWCTRADRPWRDEDRQLWARIPSRLHSKSFLIVTQKDMASVQSRLEAIGLHLRGHALGAFKDVLQISASDAILAAPGGVVADAKALSESGGRDLLRLLLPAVAATKQQAIDAARAMIDRDIAALTAGAAPASKAPASALEPEAEAAKVAPDAAALKPPLEGAPEQARPTSTAKVAPAVEPEPAPEPKPEPKPEPEPEQEMLPAAEQAAEPANVMPNAPVVAPQDPAPSKKAPEEAETAEPAPAETEPETTAVSRKLRPLKPGRVAPPKPPEPVVLGLAGEFTEKMNSLIVMLEAGDEAETGAFVRACTDLTRQISVHIAAQGALRHDAGWLVHEVDEALVQLTLLELEPPGKSRPDGTRIMLQLARDLGWAMSPVGDSKEGASK